LLEILPHMPHTEPVFRIWKYIFHGINEALQYKNNRLITEK
jgi:hypothetical protein